ncbi:MAG TPA: hypothetical protein VG733_03860 [Chthoniobacteraceae bacterium]|nr:hypothetical protein [Chthoniobacteraceae bacterium]
MGTAVIASFSVTALWIAAHLVAMHMRPAKGRMGAMFKAWLLSLPVLVIVLLLLNNIEVFRVALNGHESGLLSWFLAAVLHLLLFFLFVECFYHVERSVTLRLLVEIQIAGHPSIETIMKDYSVDDMILRRIEAMERSGFITKSGEGWVLLPKGAAYAKIMGLSCWIFQSKTQDERM